MMANSSYHGYYSHGNNRQNVSRDDFPRYSTSALPQARPTPSGYEQVNLEHVSNNQVNIQSGQDNQYGGAYGAQASHDRSYMGDMGRHSGGRAAAEALRNLSSNYSTNVSESHMRPSMVPSSAPFNPGLSNISHSTTFGSANESYTEQNRFTYDQPSSRPHAPPNHNQNHFGATQHDLQLPPTSSPAFQRMQSTAKPTRPISPHYLSQPVNSSNTQGRSNTHYENLQILEPDRPSSTVPDMSQNFSRADLARTQSETSHSNRYQDQNNAYDGWSQFNQQRGIGTTLNADPTFKQSERPSGPMPDRQSKSSTASGNTPKPRARKTNTKGDTGTSQPHIQHEAPTLSSATETRIPENHSTIVHPNTTQNIVTAQGETQAKQAADLESQMRALMSTMKELNKMNPQLMQKVWNEERKSHVNAQSPKPQVAQTSTDSSRPSPIPPAITPGSSRSKDQPIIRAPTPALSRTVNRTSEARQPSDVPSAKVKPPVQGLAADALKQQGNTIWPPEKRAQLAEVAAQFLDAIPENKAKALAPNDISQLLDLNPSYIRLCEMLEGKGIKLERASFARALLKAVPDVKSASKTPTVQPDYQASLPKPNATPKSSSSIAESAPSIPSSNHNEIPQQQKPSPATHSSLLHSGLNTFKIDSYQDKAADSVSNRTFDPQESKNVVGPSAQKKPLGLSAKPATKEEAARKRNFSDIVDLTEMSSDDEIPNPAKRHQSFPLSAAPMNDHTLQVEDTRPVQSSFNTNSAAQPTRPVHAFVEGTHKDLDIVKPISRKKAIRRSTYNVKTIARDVLIASGRHPHMQPLNSHLDVLRLNFKAVEVHSDLDTFRWDLVDPGEPPVKSNVHRDVNGSAEADNEDESEAEESQNRLPAKNVSNSYAKDQNGSHPRPVKDVGFKTPSRRGRPPKHMYGYQNRHSAMNDDRQDVTPNNTRRFTESSKQMQSTKKSTPPNLSMQSPGTDTPMQGTGYSVFRQQTDSRGGPKRRGRPVGWRKAIHGSAATRAGATPKSHDNTPKAPKVPQDETAAPASQVFPCEWKDCDAKLHNLGTLRKHVHKVHNKFSPHGGISCLWSNCGEDVDYFDRYRGIHAQKRQRIDFTSETAWRAHIELAHIGPVAWKFGDGPMSGLSDSYESEAYLSDSRGRQVTPRVEAPSNLQEIPEIQTRRPGRPPKKSQEQEALDAQRVIEKKKQFIGPGLDRGGARLATEKRRQGFVDDDDDDEEDEGDEGNVPLER